MILAKSAGLALRLLRQGGHEAYAVGGCVRDSLMNNTPADWDICTSATPPEMLACFMGCRVIETGLKHGTVTVLLYNEPIEVTTYRADGPYTDNRHPDNVRFVRSLQEDLARRDFTINAMAYSPEAGLVDPFGGQADISGKIIRCVGEADLRFREDALRILRALRFAARFRFQLEEATEAAARHSKALLAHISPERLRDELCGILLGEDVCGILLAYSDVLAVFLPEIRPTIGFAQHSRYHRCDVWQHTAQAVASAEKDIIVRLAMLLHDIEKPSVFTTDEKGVGHFYGHAKKSADTAKAILKRLRFDSATTSAVCQLVYWHDAVITPPQVAKWLNRLGEAQFNRLLVVKAADAAAQAAEFMPERLRQLQALRQKRDEILAAGACFQLKDLAVKGGDLIALGYAPGAQLGKTLNTLLRLVMEEKLPNEKAALLGAAKELMP